MRGGGEMMIMSYGSFIGVQLEGRLLGILWTWDMDITRDATISG